MRDVMARVVREDTHPVDQHTSRPTTRTGTAIVPRAVDDVEAGRDLIASIVETSLNEQGNEITKKLAAWAAVIAVPTAVTGSSPSASRSTHDDRIPTSTRRQYPPT